MFKLIEMNRINIYYKLIIITELNICNHYMYKCNHYNFFCEKKNMKKMYSDKNAHHHVFDVQTCSMCPVEL